MLSWGLWIITEWAFLIAVSVLAFDQGGAAAVGLVGAVRVLPAAVFGPFAAVVSDRLPRPVVLGGVHASWLLVSVVMAWVAASDAGLGVILIVVGVGSLTYSVFKPCVNALIPQLVHSPTELVVANSAYSTVEAGGTVLGPLLCALLLATLNPESTFLALAALFAAGAVVSALIRSHYQPARVQPAARPKLLLEPLRGFAVLLAPGGIRVAFALFTLQTILRGFLNVFIVVLALTSFDGGEGQASNLFAAVGVGGLLGAAVTLGVGAGEKTARWFTVGIILWGLPVLVIGMWPEPAAAWLALAVLGFGNAIEDVYGFSLLNRLVPDHLAGRAFGAFHSSAAAAIAAGSLLAPLLIAGVGLSWAMAITGSALVAAAVLLWPALRKIDARLTSRPEDLELLGQVPMFAPMSHISLERLVRSTEELLLRDGEAAVRQGEVGDRFYVIARGCLSVDQNGVERRRLGPGEAFGEIALLQTVPRTASVTSVGASRLLGIDGHSFVAAVTGHRGAEQAARRTVEHLLATPESTRGS